MSPKLKRLLRQAMKSVGLVFFLVAAYMIYTQLSKYSWTDIQAAILSVPLNNFIYAGIACVLSYIVISSYDRLAVQYIGRKVEWYKWMMAGFLGFAVSNNAGTAIVSGAAVRYRLYTRWRFQMSEIFRMIIFSGMTYLVGCLFLIVIGYAISPPDVRSAPVVVWLFWPCLFLLAVYFAAPFILRFIKLKWAEEKSILIPGTPMAIKQVLTGATDTFFASLILYSLLYPIFPISFEVYLGVFAISQVLGVFTPVPGAVGVFEGLFLFLLPGSEGHAPEIFGALILYRIIYYLIPLIIAGIAWFFVLPQVLRLRKSPPLAKNVECKI